MVLADSNILIYATQPEHTKLRQWLLDTLPKVSIISRVEILGYHKLQEIEQSALTELLDNLELVYLTPACYEIAIQLRQRQKLTLGDARRHLPGTGLHAGNSQYSGFQMD